MRAALCPDEALRGDIKDPSQTHGDGESDAQQGDQEAAHPGRNTHNLIGTVDNLYDDERNSTVEGCHTEDPPAAELSDEGR